MRSSFKELVYENKSFLTSSLCFLLCPPLLMVSVSLSSSSHFSSLLSSSYFSLFSFFNSFHSLFFKAILSCLSISSSFNLSTSALCFNNSSSSFVSFKLCSYERLFFAFFFFAFARGLCPIHCQFDGGVDLPIHRRCNGCKWMELY